MWTIGAAGLLRPPSVSGLYLDHMEAGYFNVGRIERDHVEDHARRKGLAVAEVERWLGQNVGYEP